MVCDHIYKILFFLQSASFILFIMKYFQSTTFVYAPIRTSEVDDCKCKENAYDPVSFCRDLSVGPGRLLNCTLADIKMRPGVILLTTTNFGFLDITMNMFESIKRTGVCVNTTVIAEDKKVHKYLSKRADGDPGVNVMLTDTGETAAEAISRKNARAYYGFMNKRQGYILNLLKQGFDVLFSDSDTFWFQDPFPYFEGNFDLSAIDPNSPYPTRTSRAHYCAGFVYFKATKVTIQFVTAWIEAMSSNIKRGKIVSDQNVMNSLLYANRPVYVTTKPLDTNIFPYGPKFYELLAKKANYSTVVMHAASIRGHDAKVTKFKSSNMWLINKTNEELLALGPKSDRV